MLFLVSNFCCKSFATSNEETIDKVVNCLKSNQNSIVWMKKILPPSVSAIFAA